MRNGKVVRTEQLTTARPRPSKPSALVGAGDVAGERGDRAGSGFEAWNARDMDRLRARDFDSDAIADVAVADGLAGAEDLRAGREAVVSQSERLREAWDADRHRGAQRVHRSRRPVVADGGSSGEATGTWRPRRLGVTRRLHGARRAGSFASSSSWDARGGPRSRGAVGARRSRRLLSLRDTARAMSQENVEVVRARSRRAKRRRSSIAVQRLGDPMSIARPAGACRRSDDLRSRRRCRGFRADWLRPWTDDPLSSKRLATLGDRVVRAVVDAARAKRAAVESRARSTRLHVPRRQDRRESTSSGDHDEPSKPPACSE